MNSKYEYAHSFEDLERWVANIESTIARLQAKLTAGEKLTLGESRGLAAAAGRGSVVRSSLSDWKAGKHRVAARTSNNRTTCVCGLVLESNSLTPEEYAQHPGHRPVSCPTA